MKKLLLLGALLIASITAAQGPTGTVTGQILTREGQPVAGVRVSAMAVPDTGTLGNSATALISIAMTDNAGQYRLENVLAGRYYIMAGFVDLPTYYPGVSSLSGATIVSVLSGAPVTGINFAIAVSVGVTVSGRVVRASGPGAVGGQRVALVGSTSGVQEAATTADGSFQFLRIRPGNYQLASTLGRTSQPISIVVGEKDVTGLELVIVPTVVITGTIAIDGDGLRPRLQLQFAPFKGTTTVPGAALQPDGTFRVMLPEGDYRVSWSNLPPGYEIKSITSGTSDLLSTALKVAVASPPSPLKVTLSVDGKPWVKLAGRVTGLNSNQTLTLNGPAAEPIQIPVKPDGTFEIARMFPGSYTARVTPPVAMQLINQIVVPNQDTTDMVIAMPPTKEIRGLVATDGGAGVQSRMTVNWTQTRNNGSSSGSFSVAPQTDGRFSIQVPEGEHRLSINVIGYALQSFTYGTTDLLRDNLRVTTADTGELRVVVAATSSTVLPDGRVVGGVAGGVVAGVSGGISGGVGGFTSSSTVVLPPPPPPVGVISSSAAINRVAPDVAQANLISSVPPVYPPLADAARVQGTVVLQIEISTAGRVQNTVVQSGHALLNDAALRAVRQWVYKPFVLNGQTVPVMTIVNVNFALP